MNSNIDYLLQELDSIESRRNKWSSDIWSEEETKRFTESIKRQFVAKEYLTSEISELIDWELVSYENKRSIPKCRKYWFKSIRIKLINENNYRNDCWDHLYDTSRLINVLYKSKYQNEDQIDWDFLKEKFHKIISTNNLFRVWRRLKISVPESDNKKYKEIIEWLYRHKTCDEIVISDDEI